MNTFRLVFSLSVSVHRSCLSLNIVDVANMKRFILFEVILLISNGYERSLRITTFVH